jgi:HAD superfamily hydrolase (TIGR01509 family)
MKIQSVIFDCDGVLIDSEIIANRIAMEIKNKLGIAITLEEQIKKFTGLGHNHPVLLEERKRLPANYTRTVNEQVKIAFRNELKVIAGVMETLKQLALPKCVASSSEPEGLEFKLKLTHLGRFFPNAVFNGRMVANCKPAPDLFLHAIKTMDWETSTCLVVEDSVAGVQAGRAAGLTVCGFLGGMHIYPGHAERLKAAGAHHIVEKFADLVRFL